MFSSSSQSRSGAGGFIALVGPDGVGKTTIATELENLVGSHRFTYFHFAPPIRSQASPAPGQSIVRVTQSRTRIGTVLRLAKNFAKFWVGYLLTVRPRLAEGGLVVADRWAYSYIVDPDSVRFALSRETARRFVRSLPRPSRVFVLEAPAELIRARKGELDEIEIESQLSEWRQLPVQQLHVIDATRDPTAIARDILRIVWS